MEEELKKSKKKSTRSKKDKRDTWTVLAILSALLLVAIGISIMKSTDIDVGTYSGGGSSKKYEDIENARNVILGAGGICAIVVVVYLIKRARAREEKLEQLRIEQENQKRLEQARERVAKAKMQEQGRNQKDVFAKDIRQREIYDDDLDDEDYQSKRRERYRQYMEEESKSGGRVHRIYDKDDEVYFDDEIYYNESGIKSFIKKNALWIGLGAGLVIVLAATSIIYAILL